MAAIPPQQQGMASTMPTPHTASFAQLFALESTDPHSGDYTQLLEPFNLNVNNNPPNMDPATVRSLLTTAGHLRSLLAMGIFVDGKMRIFFLPFKHEQGLGAIADPSIDGKYFALDGELIHNTASTVEIDSSVFHQINNQVLVRTLDALKTELAGNTDPMVMVGPFATGDADTEAVLVRKCIPLPNKYVALFMAAGDGVTPRYFFDTVLPVMEADGTNAACLPLIRYFQVALTRRNAASITSEYLNVNRPSPVPRNSRLINHVQHLIFHHFPQVNPSTSNIQHNQIASGITALYDQREKQYQEAKLSKELEKKSVVSSVLSVDVCEKLCRLIQVPSEDSLPPLWHDLAKAKSDARPGVVKTAVMKQLHASGESHLAYEPTTVFVKRLFSGEWVMHSTDLITAGSTCNSFHFTDPNIEQLQKFNQVVALVESGAGSVSINDANQILTAKVTVPTRDSSLRCLQRQLALFRCLFHSSHPALVWLSQHYKKMKSFESQLYSRAVKDGPEFQSLLSTYHLHWVNLRLNAFFNKQQYSDTWILSISTPYDEIVEKCELDQRWEPHFSRSFLQQPGVSDFILREQHRALAAAAAMGALGGVGNTPPAAPATPTTPRNPGSNVPTTPPSDKSDRVDNSNFNGSLFDVYKSSATKCKALRDKIQKQELRALPLSKVDNQPMCLAFHSKGLCNKNCPRAADHVPYSSTEYADLVSWCKDCYES